MHIIWLIQRRFPNRGGRLIAGLALASASALVIGVGVLVLQTVGR